MNDFDIRVAEAIRSTSTRRGFVARVLRWTVAASGTIAGGLAFSSTARAANCSYYGISSTWGCVCNPGTATCTGGQCAGGTGNCASGYKRCDYWTQPNSDGQYCWCSDHCYWGSQLGYFTCCDCYTTSGSGCNRAAGHCVCPQWHCLSGC